MTEQHQAAHLRDYKLERLAMLSDGVFAITMTLTAFDLREPEHWNNTLAGLLNGMAGPFQAFVWSFFATAMFWLTNRRMFGAYQHADRFITGITLLLLGEITLIPVVTRMAPDLVRTGAGLYLYLGLFALIGVTNAASWLYATAAGIVHPPRGLATIITATIAQCIVPVTACGLGIGSILPGHRWLPALIVAVIAADEALRHMGRAYDRAHAQQRQGEGRIALSKRGH
jgi:uncharacterized membrane protein